MTEVSKLVFAIICILIVVGVVGYIDEVGKNILDRKFWGQQLSGALLFFGLLLFCWWRSGFYWPERWEWPTGEAAYPKAQRDAEERVRGVGPNANNPATTLGKVKSIGGRFLAFPRSQRWRKSTVVTVR